LFYYKFINGVIDEEEDVLLVVELDLFIINTIILPEPKILVIVVANAKIDTNTNIGIDTKIGTK
jgi:hypothetical protein